MARALFGFIVRLGVKRERLSTLVYLGVFCSFRDDSCELPHLTVSKRIDRREIPAARLRLVRQDSLSKPV